MDATVAPKNPLNITELVALILEHVPDNLLCITRLINKQWAAETQREAGIRELDAQWTHIKPAVIVTPDLFRLSRCPVTVDSVIDFCVVGNLGMAKWIKTMFDECTSGDTELKRPSMDGENILTVCITGNVETAKWIKENFTVTPWNPAILLLYTVFREQFDKDMTQWLWTECSDTQRRFVRELISDNYPDDVFDENAHE